ncbi:acid protease [Lindgomyces ingoldianus]|uniref:Acid protease n=1 Tax=Lindgomyces ingoldianus TaxID=673940 RepID=A0ACB6Q757_9PLEO|nr:acid protease [Lindgomyces ingoldianus]KAF2462617.1 acid protease [Lindgomyces ingoldianus]
MDSFSDIFQKPLRLSVLRNGNNGDGQDDTVFSSMYVVDIGLGNPPVGFRAQLDTSWGPLFVPSTNCTYDDYDKLYCEIHPLYNSSSSSTYKADLRSCKLEYPGQAGIHTWGNVSRDSIHISDLEIADQLFEEAVVYYPTPMERDDLFDTALGLALRPIKDNWNNFPPNASYPFQSMVEKRLLDEPIFSLRLGRSSQEGGELILGGRPEDMDNTTAIELPLTTEAGLGDRLWEFYASNGWQVALQNMSMTFNASGPPTPLTTENTTAMISSSFPWIALPEHIARRANEQIGVRDVFDWVECEKREELPNWRLALGPLGQQIELTPWDYLIEAEDDQVNKIKCVSAFIGMGEERSKQGFILLGNPFLNGLHSVFDAGRRSILLANRPR